MTDEKKKPKYRVYISCEDWGTKESKLQEVGAAWENTSQKGKKYLTLELDKVKRLVLFPIEE